MTQLDTHAPLQDIPIPEPGTMTLEEFLENDVEGFEYVKGELVPMPAASIRHGAISIRIIRYLDPHIHKNKLGHLYTAETSFKVGERVLKPDVAFVSAERMDEDEDKGFPIPLTSQLKWFLHQIFILVSLERHLFIWMQAHAAFGLLTLYQKP